MIKAPMGLQELRRRIYDKAKSDLTHRFWGLFVPVAKLETLHEAYRVAKRNGGAAGLDGQTFEAIEQEGRWRFLAELQQSWSAAAINLKRIAGLTLRKCDGMWFGVNTPRQKRIYSAPILPQLAGQPLRPSVHSGFGGRGDIDAARLGRASDF
jgi:hypothetical protein